MAQMLNPRRSAVEAYEPPQSSYDDFLASKAPAVASTGAHAQSALHPILKPHQTYATERALQAGRFLLALDTGLGKTFCEIEWARIIAEAEKAPAIIFCPLAVAPQTIREAARLNVEVHRCYEQADVKPGVNIANFDRLDKFKPETFSAVVLDESAILRDWTGKTKRAFCAAFEQTPYKLCASATPAPNDHMEIGNQAEFLGIMPAPEMLSRWFITTGDAGKYRLKGHAIGSFWDWVSSWALCMDHPGTFGFPHEGYDLPPLELERHMLDVDQTIETNGALFRMPALSATDMHREKRLTIGHRAALIRALVRREPHEPWLIWCDTDYEADALMRCLPKDAIEVRGSMPGHVKEDRLDGFSTGRYPILVTKPRIAGHGLNWQHCGRIAFVGLSFSFDALYQAVRRCWRFGRTSPVHAHIAMASTEVGIWDAVSRKMKQHDNMKIEMLKAAKRAFGERHGIRLAYNPKHLAEVPSWLTSQAQ